ncbi:MAG: hypothetical protein GY711_08560 [bacterium]|nr:hypothetical protein [bacterium]
MREPSIVAGIDEAGFGSLLGPMTLGFSAFRVPGGGHDLWKRLARYVSSRPSSDKNRIIVADSKKVFARNPRGERRLETTALAFLAQACPEGRGPTSGAALLQCAPPRQRPSRELLREHPWYEHLPEHLPTTMEGGALRIRIARLARALAAHDVELVDAGVRAVPAGELNASFEKTDNKAVTHWHLGSALIAHLWRTFGTEGLDLVVDRLGGRSHYGSLLEQLVRDARVETVRESAAICEYHVWTSDRSMRVRFAMQGEDHSFAVALGSCFAKYAREVSMAAFNKYFAELQPGLKPTAGYTTDGRRWLEDARAALANAGVDERVLVRER